MTCKQKIIRVRLSFERSSSGLNRFIHTSIFKPQSTSMGRKPIIDKEKKTTVMEKVKEAFTKQEGVKSTNANIKYIRKIIKFKIFFLIK